MKRRFVVAALALAVTTGLACGGPKPAPILSEAPELALAPTATAVPAETLTAVPIETPTGNPTPTASPTASPTPAPVPQEASFEVDIDSGGAPLIVQFTNTSKGSIASVQWDFGDGTKSSEQNPSHRFTIAGRYTVRLTIAGAVPHVDPELITVRAGPPVSLEISPNRATLAAPRTTQFIATARDEFGNAVPGPVTWTTTVPEASIGSSGRFTPGAVIGTFPAAVKASLQSGSSTLVASATLVIEPSEIILTPTPAMEVASASTEIPDLSQPPLDEIGAEGRGWNIVQIAHNDLGSRGINAGLALTHSGCAYVGSRFAEQGVLVVDITDPSSPRVEQEFGSHAGSPSRELRTVEDLDLLIVQYFEAADSGGPNILEFYDISNCHDPVRITDHDLGDAAPHEFFAWRDPDDPNRLLIYVSTNRRGSSEYMTVIDASNVRTTGPVEVATFDLRDIGGNPDARLHSMSVSDDGTRVYMADTEVGFYVVDSTALARGGSCDGNHMGPNPCLKKLNPDPLSTLDPSPDGTWGGHHSFVRVPGARSGDQTFAITSDEFYFPQSCPWGWARILNVTEESVPGEPPPVEIAAFLAPENQNENCAQSIQKVADAGHFTSHNPTVLKNLVLQSWYSGGLRVYDITNPTMPSDAGVFFPKPVDASRVDPDIGSGISVWGFPIIMDGLIYVTGINEGLMILQYTGPGHEEIDGIKGPCEGNSSPLESMGSLKGRCFDE